MKFAIEHYHIEGIKTTLPFGTFVCNHEAFIQGDFDTHFVKEYFHPGEKQEPTEEDKVAAIVALKAYLDKSEILVVPK